jgi:hypothetical protein
MTFTLPNEIENDDDWRIEEGAIACGVIPAELSQRMGL